MRGGRAVTGRVASIDLVRGGIMALMALDHARVFFFGLAPSPTDLAESWPALFATRWVTHVCAPGFLLIAGVSAWLAGRGRARAELARYLALRGALLVALELTLVTFAWIPDPTRGVVLLQVIWAIGWSMIALGALVLVLPGWAIGLLGVAGMAAHPLLGAEAFAAAGLPGWLHVLLLGSDTLAGPGGTVYIVSYAILPWACAMAAGYGLAPVFLWPAARRRRLLAGLGAGLVAGFAVLRAATWGGVPDGIAPGMALPAFLNVEKYPPAPLYLAVTLGLVLLALSAAEGWRPARAGRLHAALVTLGRAPLFFYLAHLYLLRPVGLGLAVATFGIDGVGPPPLPSTPEWPLGAVYAVWLVALAALVPLTGWYARQRGRMGTMGRYL
jgi:uncharacterized membrane protein